MVEPLNVLIVEDSEDDTLLMIRELRYGNFDPVWKRVETAEALRTTLAAQSWDVIISDYTLPKLDAPTALKVVNQSLLDIPFIVIAGSIGERLAVDMMKAGAHDYLMKDNLTRLPEAVRRELRDAHIRAERKQAEHQLQQLNQALEAKVKERTAALQERESRYRALVEVIPDLLIRMHEDGTYLDVVQGEGIQLLNPEFVREGSNICDVMSLEHSQRRMYYVQRALQTQDIQVYDYELLVNGERRWEEARIIAINPEEVLVIVQDITDRKQAEAELQRTNKELVRATRLKDEFLANMSHELRTPLNAILGMAEGLQEGVFGEINQGQNKALQIIERSGSHLLELINDILDIAKIESGQIELDITPTSVTSLCQSSLAFIRKQALKKRIQVELQLPSHLPDICVDERRIRQVLINLLDNAVKFTPEGGRIALEVSTLPTLHAFTGSNARQQHFLYIAILDTGIGIAPEHIGKLFRPFVQIDSTLNRQYTGTGLGLALVKRIVEFHGGQVEVESEVGVGSTFTIRLPFSPAVVNAPQPKTDSETDLTHPSPTQAAPPLILLAEDNEANISTISSYLIAKGYRMLLARNGKEAISLTQSALPDLILMDIQMPGMDGLEAIETIRLNPELGNVPIIALTALAMRGDRDRCLAVGANDYLSKPIKLKQLATTIQHLLAPSSR